MNILVVCLGNICRSPLAEGLLRREIDRRGLDWSVSSGGTAAYHVGKPPDRRSVAVAADRGLDISDQRSYHVVAADFENYDVIFGMDRQNVADLKQRAPSRVQGEKVMLYLEYAGLLETDGPDVFDPYYTEGAFPAVYELLERASKAVAERLLNEGKPQSK